MVERVVWDHEAAGSKPVTRTKVAVLTANSKPQREFCGFCFDRRKYFEQKRI